MFCPKCSDEFRPGVTVCPDCQVSLVETLPSEPPSGAFVSVLVTTDELQLGVVRSFLTSRGIPFPGFLVTPVSLLLTLALAQISWTYFERRFVEWSHRHP